MPSTPTTKSQVQAYRFVLRRMESALVRKDPVMLHDPMRTHKRSTVVGVILGVVGLVGFLLVGVLTPAPSVPSSGIVIANPSGTVYVVSQSPHELIPVFNLASARLLLAAAKQSQQQNSGSGSQSTQAGQAAESPSVVTDAQLRAMNIPMGRETGIPDGPTALPAPAAATDWAACDVIQRDVNALDQTGNGTLTTTVLAGESNIGTSLTDGQALLVTSDNGKTLDLIYAKPGDVNHNDDSDVRAEVDKSDTTVLNALGLDSTTPRRISAALLNAIPTAGRIQNPAAGLDDTQPVVPALNQLGLAMGQSFGVQNVGAGTQYFMVVPGGRQAVTETVAQIARAENSGGQAVIKQVPPDQVNSVPTLTNALQVDVSGYPGKLPQVIDGGNKPVTCLGWRADFSDPQKPVARTRVAVDTALDLPTDPANSTGRMGTVPIGQATSVGKIDGFFMQPGLGGLVVRAASSANEFSNGPIEIVDSRGLRFSVPDLATANVLGVADPNNPSGGIPPAPESIVGLIPLAATSLDIQAVQKTFGSMPLPNNAGQFIPPVKQQSTGGN